MAAKTIANSAESAPFRGEKTETTLEKAVPQMEARVKYRHWKLWNRMNRFRLYGANSRKAKAGMQVRYARAPSWFWLKPAKSGSGSAESAGDGPGCAPGVFQADGRGTGAPQRLQNRAPFTSAPH